MAQPAMAQLDSNHDVALEVIANDTSQFTQLNFTGSLTQHNVPALWTQVQTAFESASKTVDFDLSHIERSDSAGIALLIACIGQAQKRGYSVQFSTIPPQTRALIEASGLSALFAI